MSEGIRYSHYKDKARVRTKKAAKPFKPAYSNMIINGVIYHNKNVHDSRASSISIKAPGLKSNPPNEKKKRNKQKNVTQVLS